MITQAHRDAKRELLQLAREFERADDQDQAATTSQAQEPGLRLR